MTIASATYTADWGIIIGSLPRLFEGLMLTILVSIVAMLVSLLLGLVISAARFARLRLVRFAAFAYVQVFRSLSPYIYILWVYFGLAAVTGVRFNPLVAAVISLSCLHSAYISEICRAAISSIGSGQWEAAASIGMGRLTAFVSIVLPQAARIALPLLMSQFIYLLKDSSLLALIGVADLTYVANQLVNYHSRSFEFYTAVGVIYIGVVLFLASIGHWIERRQEVWME